MGRRDQFSRERSRCVGGEEDSETGRDIRGDGPFPLLPDLLDLLEESGIIGPGSGAKPRDILVPTNAGVGAVEDESEEGIL